MLISTAAAWRGEVEFSAVAKGDLEKTGGVFGLLFWGITASSDEVVLFNTVVHRCPAHGVVLPFAITSVYEGAVKGSHGIECVLNNQEVEPEAVLGHRKLERSIYLLGCEFEYNLAVGFKAFEEV